MPPTTYSSIFDGSSIITKKDLCAILNLNMARPGLTFRASEINSAYRKRTLRMHPDRQYIFPNPIPEALCNALMQDIRLAKEYMLSGKDYIFGRSFPEKNRFFSGTDWVNTAIAALHTIQSGGSKLPAYIKSLHDASSNYVLIPIFATFVNDKLTFRVVKVLSKELAAIRPFLQGINGHALADFLTQLQKKLPSIDTLDSATLLAFIQLIAPDAMADQKQLEKLLATMQDTAKALEHLLTDEFIQHLTHIVTFWLHLVCTPPSWTHILAVSFLALLFNATSLPKFFNATTVIAEVLWEFKKNINIWAAAPLLLTLAITLLPVNIAFQLSGQLLWIATKTLHQMLIQSSRLAFTVLNLFDSLLPGSSQSISQASLALLERIFNLTIRLCLTTVLDVLDVPVFMLTNKTPLRLYYNTICDHMTDRAQPVKAPLLPEWSLIVAPNENRNSGESTQSSSTTDFFSNSSLPLHNEEDKWLHQVLDTFAEEEQAENPMEHNASGITA
ncbi:MAG: J domain-containing protein [Legionellaceae bacterium]|nr:J domain-containing protein [Legionellaceae bacterium]